MLTRYSLRLDRRGRWPLFVEMSGSLGVRLTMELPAFPRLFASAAEATQVAALMHDHGWHLWTIYIEERHEG